MIHEIPFVQNEFNSLTQFAMGDIAFRPISIGDNDDADFFRAKDRDDTHIHSGSIRDVSAYSETLGLSVDVAEIFIVASAGPDGEKWSEHRLMVAYGDTEVEDELCLDRGKFLPDELVGDESFDKTAASDRVIKALSAVAGAQLELR